MLYAIGATGLLELVSTGETTLELLGVGTTAAPVLVATAVVDVVMRAGQSVTVSAQEVMVCRNNSACCYLIIIAHRLEAAPRVGQIKKVPGYHVNSRVVKDSLRLLLFPPEQRSAASQSMKLKVVPITYEDLSVVDRVSLDRSSKGNTCEQGGGDKRVTHCDRSSLFEKSVGW